MSTMGESFTDVPVEKVNRAEAISGAMYRYMLFEEESNRERLVRLQGERELAIANYAIFKFRQVSPLACDVSVVKPPPLPQIRSTPTEAIADATLYGTGMWKR